MSTISVNNLQGLSNTIIVPAGHNLETYGKLAVEGTLKVPTWTESTKPTTNLVVGQIGYNTELLISEIWTGEETGWSTFGSTAVKTLAETVGVTPYLHYQSEDLDLISVGTNIDGGSSWVNRGSAGNNFDLVNDTYSTSYTRVTVGTQDGYKCAVFSGSSQLAFKTAATFTLETSSSTHSWTMARVYGGGTTSTGSDSDPVFAGSCYGPSTNTPDAVGGGLQGWYSSNWWNWYGNDGASSSYSTSGYSNSTTNQWIWTASSGIMKGWRGKSSSPFVNATHNSYGSDIPINGIGHVRRHPGVYSYTCTGKLIDAALFTDPLTDSQVQLLRDYYAAKYPVGEVAN